MLCKTPGKTRTKKSLGTTTELISIAVQRGQVWEKTDPKYDTLVLLCVFTYSCRLILRQKLGPV